MFNKETEIADFIQEYKVDVLFLLECDEKAENLKLTKYAGYLVILPLFQSEVSKIRIIALVKPDLKNNINIVRDLMSVNVSSLWLEVTGLKQAKQMLICGYYREWKRSKDEPNIQMTELKKFTGQAISARSRNKSVVILGDFNLDRAKWHNKDNYQKHLVDTLMTEMNLAGMTNIDMGKTFTCRRKIGGKIQTITSNLDLLFVSFPEGLLLRDTVACGVSDHLAVLAKMKIVCDRICPKVILKRCFKGYDPVVFSKDVANLPWENLVRSDGPHLMTEKFEEMMTSLLQKHAPLREVKINNNFKPGLTKETKRLLKERNFLFRKVTTSDEDKKNELWCLFKKLRNKCTRLVRRDTFNCLQQRVMKSENSQSGLWKVVNQALKGDRKQDIVLLENGTEVQNPQEILNEQFIKKIEMLRHKIKQGGECPISRLKKHLKDKTVQLFTIKPVSVQKVKKVLKSLKNKSSSGTDGINARVLKDACDGLAVPLTELVNTSIVSGEFPNKWKTAKIVPIFKKGQRSDKENYRPVSLLPVVSKVLESVVHEQIERHFESQNLLPVSQNGFRKNRSTTTALVSSCAEWMESKRKGQYTGVLLFDLSSAFDLIDCEILCRKLKLYGLDAKSIGWIRSYLTGRKQYVELDGKTSEVRGLHFGSPQGSILSPLLFIILTADIDLWIQHAHLSTYADDTTAYISCNKQERLIELLEIEASNILNYMAANKLVANPNKTELMIIRPGPQHKSTGRVKVMVGNSEILESDHVRILGIKVDNSLKWETHGKDLKRDINFRTGMLARMVPKLSSEQLRSVAHSLVISRIRYGLSLFGSPCICQEDQTSGLMRNLQIGLNNVMRVITRKKKSDQISIEKLRSLTGMKTVNQMACEEILINVWRAHRVEIPYVSKLLRDGMGNNHMMTTRQEKVGYVKGKSTMKWGDFLFDWIRLWNVSPLEIKRAESAKQARREIKKYCLTL